MTQLRLRHASACATWLIHMCGVPYSNVQHASFKCATWLITWLIGRWHYQTQVCCSVLQCVAVCCRVWHDSSHDSLAGDSIRHRCVIVCCSVLQYVAGCDMTHHMTHWQVTLSDIRKVLQPGSVYHSLVQLDIRCVTVCCSTLQCVAVCCSVCCSELQVSFVGRIWH